MPRNSSRTAKSVDIVFEHIPLYTDVTLGDGPPPALYHYTDFSGLQGILRSHCLWAAYSRTLNDKKEQLHGDETVDAFIRTKLTTAEYERCRVLERRSSVFVTCFCTDHDLLHMWRGYSGDAAGYCLEFEPTAMNDLKWTFGKRNQDLTVAIDPIKPQPLMVKIHYGQIPKHIEEALVSNMQHYEG
jgi:hypothetical protein